MSHIPSLHTHNAIHIVQCVYILGNKLKAYRIFPLTSLLEDCVSSSVQLNEEYLFWNKRRTRYWRTSRTHWDYSLRHTSYLHILKNSWNDHKLRHKENFVVAGCYQKAVPSLTYLERRSSEQRNTPIFQLPRDEAHGERGPGHQAHACAQAIKIIKSGSKVSRRA